MPIEHPSGEMRFVGGEYVLSKHKPKGRGSVNMLHCMLRCGISVPKAVDRMDLPIEQTVGLG
jgi:hypothetical protein